MTMNRLDCADYNACVCRVTRRMPESVRVTKDGTDRQGGGLQCLRRGRACHGLGDRVDPHPRCEALGPFRAGWLMVAITFTWIALTAAGPFIFLAAAVCSSNSESPADRRPSLGDAGYPLAGDRAGPIGLAEQRASPQSLVHHDLEYWPGHCLPDRGRGCLEHVGHGLSRASRRDRGGPLDQSSRTDSFDRLAHPMRPGHGRLELNGTCTHSAADLAFSSNSRTSWR